MCTYEKKEICERLLNDESFGMGRKQKGKIVFEIKVRVRLALSYLLVLGRLLKPEPPCKIVRKLRRATLRLE